MPREYDVADVFPHEELTTLPAGTTILISGPAKVGKRRLLLSLLAGAETRDEQALLVTTDGNVDQYVSLYTPKSASETAAALSLVDASSSGGVDQSSSLPSDSVATVGSPKNLTGIGIELATYLRSIEADERPARIGFDSLTTVLQYLGHEQVFRFTDVLSGRFAAAGHLSAFTINPRAHEEHVRSVFAHEFDVLVEFRQDEHSDRQLRVSGVPGVPETWVRFQSPDVPTR